MAKSPDELWREVAALTDHIHDCQSANGIVQKQDKSEAQALERLRHSAQMQLREAGSQFLKQHGFTSGGRVRGKRRIPGL
jgi:hypothetical protein